MTGVFFDSLASLGRVVVVGIPAYLALVVVLRISGKRTLAKLNAFDLVVTVALGSTFATVLLSKDIALSEGVLAFLLLVGLQFVVAWGSKRWSSVADLGKSAPRAVLVDGAFREDAMRSERITRKEILSAVRGAGQGDLSRIAAVVLETDGSLSVIAVSDLGDGSALENLRIGSPPDRPSAS
ncbi:MAG: DUF421 domain-containing protein [Caulobacter sp.]|nr:DUF421 domain-containing protein [Caulobacter sp.]